MTDLGPRINVLAATISDTSGYFGEKDKFQMRKPLNDVWMRLTLIRPFLSRNTDTVFATAWLELKTGES